MAGCGQVNNLFLVADSPFQVLASKACGVPDLVVQHENSLASWRAGERGRERNGGTWAHGLLFHSWGVGSPVLSLQVVRYYGLAARCSPVQGDAGKPADMTVPRLK